MKTYYILMVINLSLFAMPFLTGLSRLKNLDSTLRIFLLLTGISFTGECLAYFAAFRYRNNYPVYAILSIAEMVVASIYFNYSIRSFRKYNLGFFIAAFSLLAGITNLVFFQSMYAMTTYYLYYQSVAIIMMGLIAMFQVLLPNDDLNRKDITHFWIAGTMVFFWCITLLNWGLYDCFTARLKEQKFLIDYFLLAICCITNLGYTIILLKHSKN